LENLENDQPHLNYQGVKIFLIRRDFIFGKIYIYTFIVSSKKSKSKNYPIFSKATLE